MTDAAWMELGAVKKAGMKNHVSFVIIIFFFVKAESQTQFCSVPLTERIFEMRMGSL